MKATTKTKQRPGPRQQAQLGARARRPRSAQPKAARSRTWLISAVAAAGTLFAAVPLWPGPSSHVTWASGLFLVVAAVVAYFVGRTAAKAESSDIVASARTATLLVLLVIVPLFLDLRTLDAYNLPKLTVTVIGALVIVGLWVIDAVRPASRLLWRNGLHWPVLALVGWTAMTTATSVSPRMSILGASGTNEGLAAAVAFAVMFFAGAQAGSVGHAKAALSVLYFGAGGLTVLYGLIQLHDRIFPGPSWDWLRQIGVGSARSFATGRIFSTFGNPNHLGGFLAMLVPVGLALLMLYRSNRVRILILVIMAGLLVEILQTASRGALLATLIAIALAGVLLGPDMRRRPKISVPVVVAMTASVVLGALALVTVPQFSTKLSSGLDPTASLALRAELWKAGVVMANDRPLLGHGPDTWTDRVTKYKDPSSERYRAGPLSNGAHNVFVSQLAHTGYLGILLFSSLLGFASLRAVGTWRRLRQVEVVGSEEEADRARTVRLLLVAVVPGLVAYLVQACFNLSQVGLSFAFWVLLGLLCALSLRVGVPATLRVRALVGRPSEPVRLEANAESHKRVQRAREDPDGGADVAGRAVAILACMGVVLAVSVASRPYRADHNAWAARLDTASAAEPSPGRAQWLRRAGIRQQNAINLNPWEPTYRARSADDSWAEALSSPDRSSSQIAALYRARDHYRQIVALRPHAAPYLERYADILLKLHEVSPADGEARPEAIRILRRAVSADPASSRAGERLQQVLDS